MLSSLQATSRTEETGFTLLELMVSLAIAAVVLSFGVPTLAAFVKDANQVSSANQFLADLHYARSLAITENHRVVVCASTNGSACNSADWASGWLVFGDNDNDGVLDGGETIQRVSPAPTGLTVSSGEFPALISYRPNGRAMGSVVDNNFGQFLMCDDRGVGHARVIVVDFSGRPRVTTASELASPPSCP